jgi:malonyl-CoA O-methyltransferase
MAEPATRRDAQTEIAGIARERIAKAFAAAATHYDVHAALQREVADALCALVPQTAMPRHVLDLGCGTGYCAQRLHRHFPTAELYALDLALPMLQQTRTLNAGAQLVCADAALLPLARESFDLLCSSLALQWCAEPRRVFAEVARVLRPGGLALFSTFGPGSLRELRQAWAAADPHTHVNRFAPEIELLQAAHDVGLNARCERRLSLRWYGDLRELSRELKGIGAHNMNTAQRAGLTGRASFARAEQAFAAGLVPGRGIPVTYDILYLQLEARP